MLSSVLKSSVVGQYQSRGAREHAGLTTSEIYEVLVACKVMSLLVVQGHRKGHSTFHCSSCIIRRSLQVQ